MKIVLIGYRCTGKSSIGKKLAQALALPFYDTDALIEAAAGMTIREMVDLEGWPCFRQRERECIQRVASSSDGVIATGGGAVMNPDNAAALKDKSVVVWLMADVDTILARLADDAATKDQRPPLSDADVRRETEKILEERTPVYRRLADTIIDTAVYGVDKAVEEICGRIKNA
ncbi:MAG: shikimate kinase [Deltaproteobacteria bacterium]|nr:shikimate kinase [Deltaproteobacteria bacterium]